MPSTYDRCVALLSLEEKRRLRDVERTWHDGSPFGRRIVPNMRAEHFLSDTAMMSLIHLLIARWQSPVDSIDARELDNAYQKRCYEITGLGGEASPIHLPTFLGRCCSRDAFIAHLDREYGSRFGYLRPAIAYFVDNMLLLGDPGKHSDCGMTAHNAWVTWNPDDATGDPFAFVKYGTHEEVRSCLGLERRQEGLFLLFTYSCPADTPLLRATVADAELSPYFRPPLEDEKRHGWTVPWEPPVPLPNGVNYRPIPKPEAVHKPAPLSCLASVRRLPA